MMIILSDMQSAEKNVKELDMRLTSLAASYNNPGANIDESKENKSKAENQHFDAVEDVEQEVEGNAENDKVQPQDDDMGQNKECEKTSKSLTVEQDTKISVTDEAIQTIVSAVAHYMPTSLSALLEERIRQLLKFDDAATSLQVPPAQLMIKLVDFVVKNPQWITDMKRDKDKKLSACSSLFSVVQKIVKSLIDEEFPSEYDGMSVLCVLFLCNSQSDLSPSEYIDWLSSLIDETNETTISSTVDKMLVDPEPLADDGAPPIIAEFLDACNNDTSFEQLCTLLNKHPIVEKSQHDDGKTVMHYAIMVKEAILLIYILIDLGGV